MTTPNLVVRVVDAILDIVDASHSSATAAIVIGGVEVSHPVETFIAILALISFIGLIWRWGLRAASWRARKRATALAEEAHSNPDEQETDE